MTADRALSVGGHGRGHRFGDNSQLLRGFPATAATGSTAALSVAGSRPQRHRFALAGPYRKQYMRKNRKQRRTGLVRSLSPSATSRRRGGKRILITGRKTRVEEKKTRHVIGDYYTRYYPVCPERRWWRLPCSRHTVINHNLRRRRHNRTNDNRSSTHTHALTRGTHAYTIVHTRIRIRNRSCVYLAIRIRRVAVVLGLDQSYVNQTTVITPRPLGRYRRNYRYRQ